MGAQPRINAKPPIPLPPHLPPPPPKKKQKKQNKTKKLKCMRDWVTRHKFVVHLKILLLLVVSLQNNLPLAENGENFL